MHLQARGELTTCQEPKGLGGASSRPTSDSSGRRTWAWQPQAVSGGICAGDIWKVRKVKKERDARSRRTTTDSWNTRQKDSQVTALHAAWSSPFQDKIMARGLSRTSRRAIPLGLPSSMWVGVVHVDPGGEEKRAEGRS